MQSGSQATRGVADIVLLNDSFAALPAAFREGQRIRRGHAGDVLPLPDARLHRRADHPGGAGGRGRLPLLAGADVAADAADGRHPDVRADALGAARTVAAAA